MHHAAPHEPDQQRELQHRAAELWPENPALQREWIRAIGVRDSLLHTTTRYLGITSHPHEEQAHAPSLR